MLSLADKRPMTVVPRALRGLVGQVLSDRVRIDEVVGVGGMGVVFRGYHLSMDCPVAVKVALPQLGVGELVRFRREAELGGRLDHVNCISVFELSTSGNGQHYMVMPLLEGRPLSEYLTDRLPPDRVAAWGIQLLRGIAHAHRQGIIHRDIKPDNVIVTLDEDGQPLLKIVDFGLAKLRADLAGLGSNSNTTMTGLMAGTPAYMAPEQALGLGCDERSDIYSIGMVLHQMAVAALPYGDDDAYDQLRSRLTEEVPPLPGSVPAPLAQIIEKALRGKKERRYATADEMREDLQAFLAGAALPHAGNEALPPPPVASEISSPTWSTPAPEPTPAPTGLGSPSPVMESGAYAALDDAPPRRGRGAFVALAIVAILAAAAVPLALHFGDDIESIAGTSNTRDEASNEPPEIETRSDPHADALEAQLAPLVDVERLTDAERTAAAQLAFANRGGEPCRTFADGLAFVERSRSSQLLELLPRVGVPTGDGCEGLGERVAAMLGRAEPTDAPPPPEAGDEPPNEPASADASPHEPEKAPDPKSTRRPTPKRIAEPKPRPTPASKPAPAEAPPKAPPKPALPAAPRLDDGLRKPTRLGD